MRSALPNIKTKDTTNLGKKKKNNYKPISVVNIAAKALNKILASCITKHIKIIIRHEKFRIICRIQGYFNKWTF